MVRAVAAIVALAVTGCSNPDTQVFGGIAGPTGVPNAFIYDVGSAIAGIGTVKDSQGKPTPATILIVTDRQNLCKSIGDHPDYFQNPIEAYVALIMITPPDRLGSFFAGAAGGSADFLQVTAGPGNQIITYPAGGGSVAVTEFHTEPGGDGRGNFDLIFADQAGLGHEVFGKYKTQTCAALANATF